MARKRKRKRLTNKYLIYLRSPEWKALRQRIFADRGRRCERCPQTKGVFHLHHKTYLRLFNELDSDLEVLCKRCHKAHHAKPRKKKPRKKKAKAKRDRTAKADGSRRTRHRRDHLELGREADSIIRELWLGL